MIPLPFRLVRPGSRRRGPSLLLPAALGAALLLSGVRAQAIGVPQNLGNGLDKLVESHLALRAEALKQGKPAVAGPFHGYATAAAANTARLSVQDDQGRVLVRVNFTGELKFGPSRKAALAAAPSLGVTARDKTYRAGVIEGYVALGDVPALASAPGVRSVIMSTPPIHRITGRLHAPRVEAAAVPAASTGEVITQLGTYTDQGVLQHRVDQINKFYNPAATLDYEGQGLSIACISNSFAANTAHPASTDVANNDLPGNANNPVGNTTPVYIYQDDLSSATSDDEGRGMCEIVYKMAPKAKVGYGTADGGEVGFATNIRGLAGLPGFTNPGQTFAADVVVDDVGYFDEPFYGDGIIGQAVDDVAAAGVSYFSSAANDIGTNGYESVIRPVPNGTGLTAAAGNTALANTNLDLTGVPPALYAGGFHNFNPNGLSVAQLVNIAAANTVPTILQWNDPYDQAGGVTIGARIYTSSGTYAGAPVVFNGSSTPPLPAFTAGQSYQVVEAATSGNFDAIVTILNPDGTTLLVQDTGTDETVNFTAPTSGQYQISIDHYATTTGSFSLTVNLSSVKQYVTSDWNLLAFRTDTGAYLPGSSLTTNNLASNEPVELGYTNPPAATATPAPTGTALTSVQYVFARSNTPPAGTVAADHVRYLLPGNGRGGYGAATFFSYNTVTTSGHAAARGCNGTAAYSAFRPNIPEFYSSPGPATIYFDKQQNRLATPEIRLQPGVAAMDAGNISVNEGAGGLGTDSGSDFDTAPNFSGTSAAAPHAAACALLVLQAHGGRRSVTPAQMSTLLHQTAFPHDLDPNMATGATRATNGGKVSLTFQSDSSTSALTGRNDPNSLAVSYVGPSYLTSLTFNPAGTAAGGGSVTSGNNGLDLNSAYFSNVYPGLVFLPATFPFTVGTSTGLTAADAAATFSNLAPAPSNGTSQYWTMSLAFPNANFTGGKVLRFTVARGPQHSSSLVGTVPGNGPTGGTATQTASADLFGGGVLIPEGTVINPGMAFSGTLGDGSTFSGTMKNNLGAGYSKLDGFGFINAQAAVAQPLQ